MTTSRETTTTFVERHIGNGAMGEVYELIGHKPPAVIKYMLCGKDERLKIFKNECESLKKIYHENVVRLYRYKEEGKTVGIVMEYCQKGPLKEAILDPTITYSMNTVLTWGIQLFDAIDHMYQKHKLVHRDIKPDNIFVSNEYRLKIGDFGLVKVVGDGTITGTFIGTQRYMSPPEIKADGVQRDVYERVKEADVSSSHRNDVYSLGLVMWEIIERRTIFKNYEMPNYEVSGGFNRDQLLFDIALKRVTEIESPECQSEIQKIISKCTNFQRIHRSTASQVLDFLKQTQKANEFISSLPFMPTEDKNQKELMKPIGFDDKTEWITVETEERKYEKRFKEGGWGIIDEIMLAKLQTLNFAERDNFYKEAPNIVSRLKQETETFKDVRYVIKEILEIEEEKENLHEKDIYEIFELFVLGDFQAQRWEEYNAFADLQSHDEIWISSFKNWRWCENPINRLKKIKREKYTTNFYFRCLISQLTGEGWIHIEKFHFVSEDFKLWKRIPGYWVDNPRTEIGGYRFENEDEKHEFLYFSHYKQIPLERIIKAFQKKQKRIETIIKLNLKHLIPIEDSEKNNVPFNIESLLDESSRYKRSYGPHPFSRYIFQLRNPPRPICQRKHLGKCQMDGFRKGAEWYSNLPKELHFPVCGEITENEVLFLDDYLDCIPSHREFPIKPFGLMKQRPHRPQRPFRFMERPFLFLFYCQNLLDIPFLILFDHPNNYENGETILGFDCKKKLHHIDVEVLRRYFQGTKLKERLYALLKIDGGSKIRVIDYQGNPKTEWLDFKKVAEFEFEFTDKREKLGLVVEDQEVTKRERERRNPCCFVS